MSFKERGGGKKLLIKHIKISQFGDVPQWRIQRGHWGPLPFLTEFTDYLFIYVRVTCNLHDHLETIPNNPFSYLVALYIVS